MELIDTVPADSLQNGDIVFTGNSYEEIVDYSDNGSIVLIVTENDTEMTFLPQQLVHLYAY